MSSVEIEAIKKEVEADPSRDIDEMIKKSRKRKIVHELTIKLLNDDIEQLKRYAKDHDLSEDKALANLVKKALTEVTESNSSK
jgi:mRNA-degrading endonuclease YafQ of YafQ-DinJ toxin-antitoxin module